MATKKAYSRTKPSRRTFVSKSGAIKTVNVKGHQNRLGKKPKKR